MRPIIALVFVPLFAACAPALPRYTVPQNAVMAEATVNRRWPTCQMAGAYWTYADMPAKPMTAQKRNATSPADSAR